jgi:hypothetical protein
MDPGRTYRSGRVRAAHLDFKGKLQPPISRNVVVREGGLAGALRYKPGSNSIILVIASSLIHHERARRQKLRRDLQARPFR